MTRALIWLAIVYAGLKFWQLMMGGERGYRQAPIRLPDRLRVGEPWLLLVAAVVAVPPAVATTWYHQHKFAAVLARATDCYGRLAAHTRHTPAEMGAADDRLYQRLQDHRAAALDAAAQLGRDPAVVRRELDGAPYAAVARSGTPAQVQRCLYSGNDGPNA